MQECTGLETTRDGRGVKWQIETATTKISTLHFKIGVQNAMAVEEHNGSITMYIKFDRFL